MFSELIYTRCRQGIDILKAGRPITSDGFKVYSCTPSLLDDGKTDLQFLFNAAQSKQPYSDPGFMDDAYLYFVPDKGDSFMLDFHPVPYDPDAKGDYSHRAGNFVNHILTGDFSTFYPFEFFRDDTVWNAKSRGEAYYYENNPTALPTRGDVNDPSGQIAIDELASFISDGRKEALIAAVSFLFTQYELPPENRKFIVIRDESTKMIELWIAAIEYAFSPRIAASISFATRMDKFATANRYTVNQLGVYQTQINLQDPNQKQRHRAMIVGVDERDKANIAAARPLANSHFVLLDGKEKRAMFETDTSNRYYRFITNFDDSHLSFCRGFLQMFDVKEPCRDVFSLFDVYAWLQNATSFPDAETVVKYLPIMGKYKIYASTAIKNLYNRITAELPRFLNEHLHSALKIIKWLQTVSQVIGDQNATQSLTKIVCGVFSEQVYKKPNTDSIFGFWEIIKNSEFASAVAGYIVAPSNFKNNVSYLQQYKNTDKINFVLIYLECAELVTTASVQSLKNIVNFGLKTCARENAINSAQKILKALSQNKSTTIQEMLLSIASGADNEYKEFIVKLLIESDKSIIATDSSMLVFFKKLSTEKIERLIVPILKYRIRTLSKAADIEQFIKLVKKIQPMDTHDLAEVFESLDSKFVITEKGSASTAVSIQQEKPQEAKCINSAHLYAIEVLNDKQKRAKFIGIYDELAKQGFPSAKSKDYIQALTDKLFKAHLEQNELEYIIKLFARVPEYLSELVNAILAVTTPKRNDEWNTLIAVVVKANNQAIYDAIVSECAKLKQGEKALVQLGDMLESEESRDYFKKVAEKTKEIIHSQKSQSGLGKVLGMFKGDK